MKAHGRCESHTDGQEPEFDADRVIWDADYRRSVMARLHEWRIGRNEYADTTSSQTGSV